MTKDQAILILIMFKAQNADKTMGELFPERIQYRDVKIKELKFAVGIKNVFLQKETWSRIMYIHDYESFRTWNSTGEDWYDFDIFKFISFEDKV